MEGMTYLRHMDLRNEFRVPSAIDHPNVKDLYLISLWVAGADIEAAEIIPLFGTKKRTFATPGKTIDKTRKSSPPEW